MAVVGSIIAKSFNASTILVPGSTTADLRSERLRLEWHSGPRPGGSTTGTTILLAMGGQTNSGGGFYVNTRGEIYKKISDGGIRRTWVQSLPSWLCFRKQRLEFTLNNNVNQATIHSYHYNDVLVDDSNGFGDVSNIIDPNNQNFNWSVPGIVIGGRHNGVSSSLRLDECVSYIKFENVTTPTVYLEYEKTFSTDTFPAKTHGAAITNGWIAN